jgi:hypothetical protein
MTTLPNKIESTSSAYDVIQRSASLRKKSLLSLRQQIKTHRTPELLGSSMIFAFANVEGMIKDCLGTVLIMIQKERINWSSVTEFWRSFFIDYTLSKMSLDRTFRPALCLDDRTDLLCKLHDNVMSVDAFDVIRSISSPNALMLRKVLKAEIHSLGDYNDFIDYFDEGIAARRHKLAHGHVVAIEETQAITAIDETVRFIDLLFIDFGNIITEQRYLKTK